VTTPSIPICTAAVNDALGAGEAATSSTSIGVEDAMQITVVLNDVIYDAVISPNARTAEISAFGPALRRLPDGDYMLRANVFGFARSHLTPHTSSIGNDPIVSGTLAGCSKAHLPPRGLSVSFGDTSTLANQADIQQSNFSLAESGIAWEPNSTRKPRSKHGTVTVRNARGRLVLPANIVLTPRVLLGALARLDTPHIEIAVEVLLEVLDSRCGDSDLEADADSEIAAGEESRQTI
jgi:hypothetical protein